MSLNLNEQRIWQVYNSLGPLQNEVVFVGGATLSLYAQLPILDIRPTKDIDVVIEVATYGGYAALEEQVRKLGFKNDIESGIICRFRLADLVVDFMPTENNPLGFTNQWYKPGFASAVKHKMANGTEVKIFTAPYFIASKFEAFKSRGSYNGITSHDFEDIVFILENRPAIWKEVDKAPETLKSYLKQEFTKLLEQPAHFDWIDSHVERSSKPATYRLLEEIRQFVSS